MPPKARVTQLIKLQFVLLSTLLPVIGFAQAPVVQEPETDAEVAAEVKVQFVVNDKGTPVEITVISSTDPEMNEVAVDAVSKWTLDPKMSGKKAQIPVKFNRAAVEKQKAEKARASSPFPDAYELSQVQKAPVQTKHVGPHYPFDLRKKGITGNATVEFCIEPSGKIERVALKNATHPEFGEAAVNAVKQWRFKPALIDGKPVPVRGEAPFVFDLETVSSSK